MKIVQINSHDLRGRIFNGYELQVEMNKRGIPTRQYVMEKSGQDENVISCWEPFWEKARQRVREREKDLSMQALLYGNTGEFIRRDTFYQSADIVHFHLFYNGILSLFDFFQMASRKPTVWTIHDFWPITGHCTHPMHPSACSGWREGCRACPDLLRAASMKTDKAGQMFQIKKRLYEQLDPDVVVATAWMENYIRESPLMQHFSRIHRIPFGVHLEQYGKSSRQEARSRLGIPAEAFVIAFRAEYAPGYTVKGSQYIWEALRGCDRKVTLLTVGYEKVPEDILQRFPAVCLGWVDDSEKMADFFAACDVFLMPSAAETFGLMAIEAMASARPIVVFENTVLAPVTFAPECGITVPYKDSQTLRETVIRLMDSPEELRRRGEIGRKLAEEHYRFEDYANRHMMLYQEILERKNRKTG